MFESGDEEFRKGVEDDQVDDAFRAVMEGLRTTLPGVQVLFAFLLTLPLQSAFADLRGAERTAYFVAFYGAAVANVLLIAPSAHQRLRAPDSGVARTSKSNLLFTVRVTIAGTAIFATALASSVYLAATIVFSNEEAAIGTAAIAGLVAWSWFYVPIVTFKET